MPPKTHVSKQVYQATKSHAQSGASSSKSSSSAAPIESMPPIDAFKLEEDVMGNESKVCKLYTVFDKSYNFWLFFICIYLHERIQIVLRALWSRRTLNK